MKIKYFLINGFLLFFGYFLVGCGSIDNVKNNSKVYKSNENVVVSEEIKHINIFPRTGTWRLTGTDAAGTYWEANIVIENVKNISDFDGYFDWYRTQSKMYRGREYFDGHFNNNTSKVNFKGIRLVNTINLVLSEYEAFLTEDRKNFFNGSWGGGSGVPSKNWQGTWVDQ